MSASGIPSSWGQAYPRAVLLAPDGLLVPCGTLEAIMRKRGRLDLLVRGFALGPLIGDGARVTIDSQREPRAGDLALCDVDRWGDIRRLLTRDRDGAWITGLDAAAGARDRVTPDRIRGVVAEGFGAGGVSGRALAVAYPLWSRVAAFVYRIRKAMEAPDFGAGAVASVQEKYAFQVASYSDMLGFPLGEDLQRLLVRTFPAGGSVLVAGCGAGGEGRSSTLPGWDTGSRDSIFFPRWSAPRNATSGRPASGRISSRRTWLSSIGTARPTTGST